MTRISRSIPSTAEHKLVSVIWAQEASIYRKLSVEDNILSVLELTNRTKQEQQARLEELIAEFRLEKVRTNAGNRLSGGERRRAEIARCLAIDPKFISA